VTEAALIRELFARVATRRWSIWAAAGLRVDGLAVRFVAAACRVLLTATE
jgi:hypothetical protein